MACIFCQGDIAPDEEHVSAWCNKCEGRGQPSLGLYHQDCVVTVIEKNPYSNNLQKIKNHYRTHPYRYFKNVPCQREGCSGYIVEAEAAKPLKPAPPPEPAPSLPSAPAPAPRKVKPPRPKPAGGQQPRQQAAAAHERLPLVQKQRSAFAGFGGGKLGVPKPAVDMSDPKFLALCPDLADRGRCFAFKCPCAHSGEELEERHAAVAAAAEAAARKAEQREAKRLAKQERLRQEQEAAAAAQAQAAARAAALASQPAPLALGPQPILISHLSEAAVELVRSFKRGACLHQLLDFGFPLAAAEAASEATGGNVAEAAGLLGEGRTVPPTPAPVDVSADLAPLLALAASLGLDAKALDRALLLNSGDVAAAQAELAGHSGGGGSSGVGGWGSPGAASDGWAFDSQPPSAAELAANYNGGAALPPGSGWDALIATAQASWRSASAASGESAPVTPAPMASAAPQPPLTAHAATPDVLTDRGYGDGYAAGLTAATAMLQGQQQQSPVPASVPAPAPQHHEYEPESKPRQQRAEEVPEEFSEYLSMLGISA